MYGWCDDQIMLRLQAYSLQLVAYTFGPGVPAENENRYVGAKLHAQFLQLVAPQTKLPQVVQGQQGRGGIRTAATKTATHGDALFDGDFGTQAGLRVLLQQPGGPDDQVVFFGDQCIAGTAGNLAVSGGADMQGVMKVEQAKHGLQFMIAICATACDVQEQVDLGWCGKGLECGI